MSRPTGSPLSAWLDPVDAFRRMTGEDPLEWQEPYLRETMNAVTLKGRQVGASTCAGVLAVRAARLGPNRLAAIVSPSEKQSQEVKRRAREGLERMGVPLVLDNATTLGLGNGSRIISLPGTAKSVRGWSADFLVIDEAAFLDEETFVAARATVAATGGRVIVQSTPEGPFGHFFDMWETADPSWAKFRVSSEEVTTIDADFLASEKATMPADQYAKEYLGQFGSAGMGLVDPKKLEALTRKASEDVPSDIWGRLRS